MDRLLACSEQNMAKSVAELCELNQVTFAQLVQQSGLEESRVTAILLARWTPSPVEREKIANVFNRPVDEIAWGHKTPIQHIYGHGPG
jgi:transcriptional regulator with XRE-family HTH domain